MQHGVFTKSREFMERPTLQELNAQIGLQWCWGSGMLSDAEQSLLAQGVHAHVFEATP